MSASKPLASAPSTTTHDAGGPKPESRLRQATGGLDISAPKTSSGGTAPQAQLAAQAPAKPSDGSPRAGASGGSTSSLNDRLKNLGVNGNVDYTPKHVKIGDAQSVLDQAMLAYEQRLAPPLDILQRTFGLIYERRTGTHPDSIAYVYDSYTIGPIRMCKAWKIVEHPSQAIREVGAATHSGGIGGAVASSANSADVRHDNGGAPDIETVQFPCTEKSYRAVPRGSLTTPAPRHLDLPPAAARSPAAEPSSPAAPTPSLAP